jgi:hypothetical protein
VPPPTPVAADRDLRTVDFVAWLADHSAASFRETYDAVAARAHDLDAAPAATGHARGHALARVGRRDVAAALDAYYDASHPGGECHLYRARVGDEHLALSVVVRPSWLSAPVSLIDSERATFRPTTPGDGTVQLGPVEWRAAVARLDMAARSGTAQHVVDIAITLDPSRSREGGHRLRHALALVDRGDHPANDRM